MMRAGGTLAATALGVGLLAFAAFAPVAPWLVWNGSASAPLGLYRLVPAEEIAVGDLIVMRAPPAAAALIGERGYLPPDVPLLKRVVATAGDHVCADTGVVVINGRVAADRLLMDGQGRPLPAWSGCRTLRAGELFALMTGVPASFDSRYFGPFDGSLVIGKAVPAWIW